jgi:hypothetical protein
MSDQNIVVSNQPQPPMKADEIKAQIQVIQQVMRSVMKKDVHYGVISGTDKPTLYKPGSEILLTTFRLSVDPEIEDLSTPDEIRYRVKARGIHMATGGIVGVGVGEASTHEEKYKWRFASELEWHNTPEDRRRIKYGWKWGQAKGEKVDTQTKQVRTNPSDLANTVLKMAKKRAQIDLCLTALAASDVFEQDLEDLSPDIVQTRVNPKAQSKEPQKRKTEQQQSKPTGDNPATAQQVKLLRAKTDDAGILEKDFLAHADVSDWSEIRFSQVNELLEWIKEMAP